MDEYVAELRGIAARVLKVSDERVKITVEDHPTEPRLRIYLDGALLDGKQVQAIVKAQAAQLAS